MLVHQRVTHDDFQTGPTPLVGTVDCGTLKLEDRWVKHDMFNLLYDQKN